MPAKEVNIDNCHHDIKKLESLRNYLAKENINGFILPLADEYLGEYIPENLQAIRWLTGFTGSAGTVAITDKDAWLFVDGRYEIQAQNEINKELFQVKFLREEKPIDVLIDALEPQNIIAYNGKLHSIDEVENFTKKITDRNLLAKATPEDPFINIWKNRPKSRNNTIKIHEAKFSGLDSNKKIANISEKITEASCDALVTNQLDSIAWLLNIRGTDTPYTPLVHGYLTILAKEKQAIFFTDKQKCSIDIINHLKPNCDIYDISDISKELPKLLIGSNVMLDKATTNSWLYNILSQHNITINHSSDPITIEKAIKNKIEIQGARNAHIRDGVAICRFLAWLDDTINNKKEKITEIDASNKLANLRAENKYFAGLSFATIAAYASNGAIVHYHPNVDTNKVLEHGSLFLLDSGGQYLDGTTDITRTIAIGEPSPEMRKHFTLVLKGHIAIARAVFPKGINGSQIDILARQYLWHELLDYKHGTGHGVGSYLGAHEGPQGISLVNKISLKPGMIISNEPGYYLEGQYGIRIESLILVEEYSKSEYGEFLKLSTLTMAPIDFNLIDIKLLNKGEISWLNSYHSKIYNQISNSLNKAEKQWLKKATTPIEMP